MEESERKNEREREGGNAVEENERKKERELDIDWDIGREYVQYLHTYIHRLGRLIDTSTW